MTAKSPERDTPRPEGKKRALLDSNIWRYVVNNASQGPLLRLAREGSYDIQIAPAVLYETLRLGDAQLRAALVRLMTNSRFHRLMPEAYSESMEVLQEIERVRPNWLRDSPDAPSFDRLKKDWTRRTRGFWVRCARTPSTEARRLRDLEGDMMKGARAQARLGREEAISSEWKRNPPMDETLAAFDRPLPGWRGDMVEAWRWESLGGLTHGLRRGPYRDWIAPFVKLNEGLLDSAAWVEFWLYLTDKHAMPRQWMRWAHSFAQRFRKVSPGSPADTQLFTYFLDTDVVITADKPLLDILEECRPYAPCPLPSGKIIPASAPGVAKLLRMLELPWSENSTTRI